MPPLPPLSMYRQLLRAARHYPSVKKDSVIAEIKQAYRENRSLTDQKQLDYANEEATAALNLLRRYVGVKHNQMIGFSMEPTALR